MFPRRSTRFWTVATIAVLLIPVSGAGAQSLTSQLADASKKKEATLQSVSKLEAYIISLKKAMHKNAGSKKESVRERLEEMKQREKTPLGFLDAYHYYLKQRAYPNDKVDWSAYKKASEKRDAMLSATIKPPTHSGGAGTGTNSVKKGSNSVKVNKAVPGNWEFVGPANMTTDQRFGGGTGLISGRVNAMAFSGAPGQYYAGSAGGGVWRSDSYGINWTPLSDQWEGLNVSSIAVDPKNSNIVYVGTGDFQGFGAYQFGLMKSVDGGNSWINLGRNEFGTVAVSRIVVDPDDSQIVTVSTGRGYDFFGYVWRSTDGGSSWNKAFDSLGTWDGLAVSVADKNGARMYYAVGDGAIWGSVDHGQTWSPLPLPSGANLGFANDVATSKLDPGTVYLISNNDSKIFKSLDSGQTWTDITAPIAAAEFGQGWYDYYIGTSFVKSRLTKRTQDVVYVGLFDVWQSANGQGNWQPLSGTYTGGDAIHTDQHAMDVNPADPNQVLLGNDGGVYGLKFKPALGGGWNFDTRVNATLGITQFYRASYHPFKADKMFGGTQDNSTPASFGDLKRWRSVAGGDGGFCEIHPLSPGIQWATAEFLFIFLSVDGWNSYNVLFPPAFNDLVAFIAPIAVDPSDPNVLYAGTNYLYRYDIKKDLWTGRLGDQLLSDTGALLYVAVAPSDGKYIYTGSSDGQVYATVDRGKSWTRIDNAGAGLPNRSVTSIVVDPIDPKRILVTLSGTGSGHVFSCADTTAPQWADISGGLPDIPTNTIALDLTNPASTYYVGNDVGVFMTSDSGASWSNATQPLGLPNVQVNDLKTVIGTGYLNAATFGRGIWRVKIADPALPVADFKLIPDTVHGGDPTTGEITIIGEAPEFGQVVTLATDNPAVVTIPATTTIPAGYVIKHVVFNTKKVANKTIVKITASSANRSRTVVLTVVP